jgi:hypothetical protein
VSLRCRDDVQDMWAGDKVSVCVVVVVGGGI